MHPVRPGGYSSFSALSMQFLFELYDPEATGLPLEVRHPYFDIRMLRYLLALPVIPWCRNKFVMRRSLKPYLPPEVIARPKEGLQGFPNYEQWKRMGVPELPNDLAAEYVDFNVLQGLRTDSPLAFGDALRPLALVIFIAQRRREMI